MFGFIGEVLEDVVDVVSDIAGEVVGVVGEDAEKIVKGTGAAVGAGIRETGKLADRVTGLDDD